jgi:hypothetical protein
MKAIVFLLGLATLAGGLLLVAEATQNRPDRAVPGSVTVVELAVDTRDFAHGERVAVAALWSTCATTVGGQISAIPEAAGAVWTATVSPALGQHGEKRLVGCLEDATIDRVVGDVRAVRTVR